MPVRGTMSDLISRVRLLIGDPSGASEFFGDQDIQDVLDASRVNVYNALLRPEVTLVTNGVVNYTSYLADQGDWEADATIQNAHFDILSDMSASDYLTGHWTWNLASPGKIPPLFITGKYYDRYRASAELLERWSAALAANYDFGTNGQSFKRSQAFQMKLDLAAQYRKKALVHSIPMVRSDESDDNSGMGLLIGNYDVFGW